MRQTDIQLHHQIRRENRAKITRIITGSNRQSGCGSPHQRGCSCRGRGAPARPWPSDRRCTVRRGASVAVAADLALGPNLRAPASFGPEQQDSQTGTNSLSGFLFFPVF
jgi:hypothetical protein